MKKLSRKRRNTRSACLFSHSRKSLLQKWKNSSQNTASCSRDRSDNGIEMQGIRPRCGLSKDGSKDRAPRSNLSNATRLSLASPRPRVDPAPSSRVCAAAKDCALVDWERMNRRSHLEISPGRAQKPHSEKTTSRELAYRNRTPVLRVYDFKNS